MSAKRIAVLVIVPIAVFAVSVGLFLLLAHPGRAGAAEPPSYTLGEDSGKLALSDDPAASGADEVVLLHPAKGRASISTARNKDNAFVIFFMIFFSFLLYHIKGATLFLQSTPLPAPASPAGPAHPE